jgi:O-antigen ligase
MATQRRQTKGWFGRIADELYVGSLVAAGAIGLVAAVALLLQVVLQFTHWAEQLD